MENDSPELDLEPKPKPQRRVIEKPEDMLVFALAGKARFTLESKTGARYTYKVTAAPDNAQKLQDMAKVWFVGVLTGSDNENAYTYLGTIRPGQGYRAGRKSPIDPGAPSAKAFMWFWAHITAPSHWAALSQVAFYHEGHCGKCGRTLTVPESLDRGIGPECWKKGGASNLPVSPFSVCR